MKKILAIVLALVMTMGAALTMSSCSKDDNTLVCGVTIFENMNASEELMEFYKKSKLPLTTYFECIGLPS